jgi:hypothetical protein
LSDSPHSLPLVIDDLSPEWMTTALADATGGVVVEGVEVENVVWGSGTKVMVRVTYAEPLSAAGPPERLCIKGGFNEDLRQIDAFAQGYAREADFYRHLAREIDLAVPACWYAAHDPTLRQGIVILDNLAAAGASFGEPTQAWSTDAVAQGLELLAPLHAATAGASVERYPWLTRLSPIRMLAEQTFLSKPYWESHFGSEEAPPMPEELLDRERVLSAFKALWRLEDDTESAISHGDTHIGNTYFDSAGRPRFLDWQTVCAAPPIDDVTYFIGGALTVEDRGASEKDLLKHYLSALAAAGGPEASVDDWWPDYGCHHLHGLLWATTGSASQPYERVCAMTERYATAMQDHETLSALKSAAA